VCAQPVRQSVCEVSGINRACQAGPALGSWLVGPVGDFNGDGLPDVVGTGNPSGVFLGQADGSFVAAPAGAPIAFGLGLGGAAADMNGDGKLDLVVEVDHLAASPPDDDYAIAAGRGDGTFGDPAPTDSHPGIVAPLAAVGDFDGDGTTDILGFDDVADTAFVVLGGATPQPLPAQNMPFCTSYCEVGAVADFNGDKKADFVMRTNTGFAVVFGAGHGLLSPGPETVTDPSSYMAGDVDGDGHVDLAGSFQGQLRIMRGRGDGTFGPPELQPVTAYQTDLIALADIDGDGALDLVATTDGFVLAVQFGVGDGTFGPPKYYDPAAGIMDVTVMTPNPDGTRSLAISVTQESQSSSSTDLRIFPSRCY
jgi:hypothetical protein